MQPSDLDTAFSVAGGLAMVGWASLVLLPRWRNLSAVLAGRVIPAMLSLGYAVLIAVSWHDARGGFGSLDAVAALFQSRPLLLAGWVHYLAFDLILGAWILRRSQADGIAHGLTVPVLLLTFLFGPLGYLTHLLVRACVGLTREDRIPRLQARLPASLRALEIEPRLAAAAVAMLALAVPLALAWAIDPRQFEGVSTWIKPFKFALSAAVFMLTLALFVPLAGERFRSSLAGRYLIWPVIVPLVGEILYIAWRASRAQASHYNTDSALGAALYSLMALGAVMFTVAPGILAFGLARRDASPMPDVLRWSLVAGLTLTAVLGIVSGFAMGGSPSGHFVGAVPLDHATIPVLGWSLAIGDLRVPHFLALHALQLIPLFGVLVWWLTRQSGPGRLAVAAVSTAYAAVTIMAQVAALRGLPLLGWA